MGILQLHLQAGRNFCKIHQSISRTPVRLKHVGFHHNVENHFSYLARIRLPPFIFGTMNARNNLYDNTEIIIPIAHNKSYEVQYLDWDLGMVNFPASFEVTLELDNGVQMVPIENTGYRGPVSQNPVTGVWTPAGATGNNTFQIDPSFGNNPFFDNDTIFGTLVGDSTITYTANGGTPNVAITQTTTWVSVGLAADVMAQQPTCPVIGQDITNHLQPSAAVTQATCPLYGTPVGLNGAQTYYDSSSGEMSGFNAFCYSCLLTFEYDLTSTESRVQNLY